MPAVSSVFLVIALVLAVVVGPQTRAWSWGPGILALSMAVMAALPVFWRKTKLAGDFGLLAYGMLVAGWFAWRASISPVAELGQADLILLASAVGAVISLRAIEGNPLAERILIWGIALLLLANVVVVGMQVLDPNFTPVFRSRPVNFPSGFYAQYNEAANFLIATSLLVAAAAMFGNHLTATRVVWGLIALSGLAAVYFTRSRGGILGAAVGVGAFAVIALMIGQRRKARWFGPALIAIPVVGLGIAAFLLTGWEGAQELRRQGGGIASVFDNNSRLYLLGIAVSCIGLHPLSGGGARSFSWESFRFSENQLQGDSITHKPEQVHNELIQAATDYGLIGAGLLIGLLGALVVIAVVRILFSEESRGGDFADGWRLGGLAALAGMFVQSSFSFVFHLLPGVLLLGICLGKISRPSGFRAQRPQVIGSKILVSAAAVACLLILLPAGWKGVRVTRVLWDSYLGKHFVPSDEAKIDALTEAIRIWPQSTFYQDRAAIYQSTAAESGSDELTERAVQDYRQASVLHPFDPAPVVNAANSLSRLQRDAEAEETYERAIQLQGGMEPAFRSHFSLAKHLMRKGLRQFSAEAPEATLASLEIAAQQMEESVAKMHWMIPDMREPRVAIHESLGAAREANGDYKGAMEAYDFTAKLDAGRAAHYRAGVLNGKLAAAAWRERRPAEALGYFIEAKRRISLTPDVPKGVTPSQRLEYLAWLEKTIAYLKGAKIEPVAPGK